MSLVMTRPPAPALPAGRLANQGPAPVRVELSLAAIEVALPAPGFGSARRQPEPDHRRRTDTLSARGLGSLAPMMAASSAAG